ncbi:MAG: 50S ribosomal protein L21 [Planctomycetaceae bacterium]|nr:50S ribosomal protein L21 [Planctomycetaceae bacterium]
MYAVISDRGRQSRVRVGDIVDVDLLQKAAPGEALEFSQVLLVGNDDGVRVGAPTIAGAKVTAEVLGQSHDKKLVVFRFKRRKNVRVKNGHRQKHTRIKITGIVA